MSYTSTTVSVREYSVDKIVGTEIVRGSGSEGSKFLIVEKGLGFKAPLVGGYGNEIKASDAQYYMNVTGTINSVLDCAINLYGIPLDAAAAKVANRGTPYDNTSGRKWPYFIAFLSQSAATNIKVFAVLTPRQGMLSGSGYVDRWEITGGKRPSKSDRLPGPAYNANDFIESCDTAAPKFANAGCELASLSATYPNLIGFTIDDFQAHTWRKGNWRSPETEPTGTARVRSQGYTRGQVQEIYRGCKAKNPGVQFWPTHYVGAALKNAIPADTIGFTYDFPTKANDYISVTRTFKVDEPALGGTLKFLYIAYTTPTQQDGVTHNCTKYCHINGNQILSESIGMDNRLATFETDVSAHLVKGVNIITWKIAADRTQDRFLERLYAMGDIRFTYRTENRLDSPTITLTPENGGISVAGYSINGSPTGSRPGQGTTPGDPTDTGSYGPISGGWVAEPNTNYRYIADCERTLLYYTNHPTGAVKNRLAPIFEAYRRHCPGTGIIHGQQGSLFDQNIIGHSISQKFMTGSAYSDGVVVWNYPLYQNQPTKGIYHQRTPPAGGTMTPACSDIADPCWKHNAITSSIQTTYPNWQLAVRGQYQRWTTKKTYSGDVKFRVQTVGGAAAPYHYWRTILAPSGATWPPPNPLYNNSGALNYTTPITSAASALSSQKLVFETFVSSGYGDSYTQVRLSASVGAFPGTHVHLSHSAWEFTSGVTGSLIPNLYGALKTYYGEVADDSIYNNLIVARSPDLADHPDPEYWTYYRPRDADRCFVKDPGEWWIYDASKETWAPEDTYYAHSDALIVSGSIACTEAVKRGGFIHATCAATASFYASTGSLSGAILWDSLPRIDTKYYSSSGPDIMILQSGDYKIAYGVSWYQTGALPPISLKTYVVSSSMIGRPGAPYPKPDRIRTVDSSLSYEVLDGPPGGYTRGTNSATFMTSINSTDTLKLYVEHDYGVLPYTISTLANQAWIIIEKV